MQSRAPVCLVVCLAGCLSVWLFVCLYVCLSVCMSVRLSVCLPHALSSSNTDRQPRQVFLLTSPTREVAKQCQAHISASAQLLSEFCEKQDEASEDMTNALRWRDFPPATTSTCNNLCERLPMRSPYHAHWITSRRKLHIREYVLAPAALHSCGQVNHLQPTQCH